MAKVILKPLASPDSPIYSQPLSIGARFTKPHPQQPLEDVNPQQSKSEIEAHKEVPSGIAIKK